MAGDAMLRPKRSKVHSSTGPMLIRFEPTWRMFSRLRFLHAHSSDRRWDDYETATVLDGGRDSAAPRGAVSPVHRDQAGDFAVPAG